MSFFAFANDPLLRHSRRAFLGTSGLVLSGAAVALLPGQDALAKTGGAAPGGGVRILNTAPPPGLQAIAAHPGGAGRGALKKTVLDPRVTFPGNPKQTA